MKIGFTTYPTCFQSKGGLEVHIKQTRQALLGLGVDVQIVNPYAQNLSEFDLIHQFSLNHASFRILQKAKQFDLPCVLTPMVEPITRKRRLLKINQVRFWMHKVFGYEFRSKWDDTVIGLEIADAICPITHVEKETIQTIAPKVGHKIQVIPNGVTPEFFNADPAFAQQTYQHLGRYVLVASSIVPYKNQLSVIQAAKAAGYRTVLVGSVHDDDYLKACMDAGGDSVSYLGAMPYPSEELVNLFAAAGVVVLASKIEPFGLVPFEGLATGVPAILTNASGFNFPEAPPYFQRVNPDDQNNIQAAISLAMQAGINREAETNRQACRDLVKDLTWEHAAKELLSIYKRLV